MSATKKTGDLQMPQINDGITSVTPVEQPNNDVPRVLVNIPVPLDAEDKSVKIDPYEHVTINGQKPVYVKRGEPVEVTIPVYLQLRNKYPRL